LFFSIQSLCVAALAFLSSLMPVSQTAPQVKVANAPAAAQGYQCPIRVLPPGGGSVTPAPKSPAPVTPAPKTPAPKMPAPQPPAPKTPAPQPPSGQPAPAPAPAAGLTAQEQQMLNLVNAERAKMGLPALKADPKLTQLARMKSQDMITNRYFSHNSPTYGSPFDMLRRYGVTYMTAGENIAGNQSVEAAHRALMNSPGHRANILNAQFKNVGIGIVSGGPYGIMFTQLFTG
jgi:uncharacterized YkwD family protein